MATAQVAVSWEIPPDYPPEFRKCRALGHSWVHLNDVVKHSTMAWVRGLPSYCDICMSRRTRWLSREGRRWGITYDYAEGYVYKPPTGQVAQKIGAYKPTAPSVQEWRREFVSTLDFGDAVTPAVQRRK